jgi:hypothetical protein
MPELTNAEWIDVMEALDNEIDFCRLDLKSLTEPDERYERNDVQNRMLRLQRIYNKIKEAVK